MCKNAVEDNLCMLQFVPHQYKTLEVCKKTVGKR